MTATPLKKQERDAEEARIEIDVDAVGLMSEKTLRKAKKAKASSSPQPELSASVTMEKNDMQSKSRKRNLAEAEIEIDVDAPEPPSKKALRKAKRAKSSANSKPTILEEGFKSLSPKQENSQDSNKRSDHGIWVGNLAFSTTEDDLIRLLTSDATKRLRRHEITRVHLPKGQEKFGKVQNKGFAYIDLPDEKCLATALEFSESFLGGRRVLIKNAKSFEGRPEQKNSKDGKQSHPPSRRVFVGNLDFTTTVEDLEAQFEVCGPISHTHMATFEDSGKCKGYAWIEFEQISSAEKAMRGWVEAEDSARKPSSRSKSSNGRMWVNSIQGRRLRMEYAEDQRARYEKRFGKYPKKSAPGNDQSAEEGVNVEVDGEDRSWNGVNRMTKTTKIKHQGKYSEETVQKLTGAITESKGQRTVFE